MKLSRHEAGLSQQAERFPTKGTCVSIYSRVVNARAELAETLGRHYPWAAAHEAALRVCSRSMSRPSSASACSITTICCSISRRC